MSGLGYLRISTSFGASLILFSGSYGGQYCIRLVAMKRIARQTAAPMHSRKDGGSNTDVGEAAY